MESGRQKVDTWSLVGKRIWKHFLAMCHLGLDARTFTRQQSVLFIVHENRDRLALYNRKCCSQAPPPVCLPDVSAHGRLPPPPSAFAYCK